MLTSRSVAKVDIRTLRPRQPLAQLMHPSNQPSEQRRLLARGRRSAYVREAHDRDAEDRQPAVSAALLLRLTQVQALPAQLARQRPSRHRPCGAGAGCRCRQPHSLRVNSFAHSTRS